MKNHNLYLDIDGVLLHKHPQRINENCYQFLRVALNHFDCYWLTSHCRNDENKALNYLKSYSDKLTYSLFEEIKPTYWDTMKTEGIDFSKPFYWLDDQPFAFEIEVLKKLGMEDRLIVVNLDRSDELLRIIRIITNKY